MGWLKNRKLKREKKLQAEIDSRLETIKAQLGYNSYGVGKWPYSISGSGSGLYIDHYTSRLNARTAYHDTPQARALVDRFADVIADVGLKLECAPKSDILGMSDADAEKWATDVETRFDSWAKTKNQHRSGTMTWYQAHRLYQLGQHRDNDVFMRLYYSKERNLLNPLQFEFIDPSQIKGDSITSTTGAHCKSDGINRDAQGREVSYDIWYQEGNEYKYTTVQRKAPRSNRLFMLHGFVPIYPGQGRGLSRLAHIVQEFQNLTDFTSAQIKKAINQSNIVMYVKPSDDAPATNPLDSIQTAYGAGPAAAQFGSNPTPSVDASGVTAESLAPLSYYELPEATSSQPGSKGVFNLNSGEDLKSLQSTAPSDGYDVFVDAFTSHLSASTGMPLEVLLMKFGSSYSASRAALVMFWRVAQIWRDEMASDMLNPTFEMWLSEEIASGKISAPGWSDPVLKAAWLNCNWIGSSMPNIDPMRTAKSDETYAKMGAVDLDRISRNLNGSDGKTNRAKLKRQYTELPTPTWEKKTNG